MASALSDEYLTTEVLTATPQKLHLLLIEGAMRSAVRAQMSLDEGQAGRAVNALLSAQRIMGKLIGGLNYLQQPTLAGQIAAIYAYIYKSLVQAQLHRDRAKLADAIRLLDFERETWRLACEKLASGESDMAGASPSDALRQEAAHSSQVGVPAPHGRRQRDHEEDDFAVPGGFSCEV